MPDVGVRGQLRDRILKPARIREYDDTAHQAVAHEERKERPADPFPAQPRIGEQYIHGNAAELKGHIPPVVDAVSKGEGQDKLFPDLAAQHENTAQKEQSV